MIEYNLNFMHPQYGTTLNVDIDAAFTIEEMINNLLLSGFISENKAGYDLALKNIIFDKTTTFADIEALYDGAVIRIIAGQENKVVQKPKLNNLTFYLKHHQEPLVLEVVVLENIVLSELIQIACNKNFIQGDKAIYFLNKGKLSLDLDQNAQKNSIQSGDFLQIIDSSFVEKPNPTETAVVELNEKIQQLETNIKTELGQIKDALPDSSTIPIDPTRSINPTMMTYESIDTIVGRLRQKSKQAPLVPIRPFPTKLLITLIAISLLVVLLILIIYINI